MFLLHWYDFTTHPIVRLLHIPCLRQNRESHPRSRLLRTDIHDTTRLRKYPLIAYSSLQVGATEIWDVYIANVQIVLKANTLFPYLGRGVCMNSLYN
jgi:hypothetical protein